MTDDCIWEWGVAREPLDPNGPHGPWRAGMTREEARAWVAEWEADGGRPGVFYVIRRPLGLWSRSGPRP